MTLTLEIIRLAYRESNLIALGGAASAAQESEGLFLLNRLVSGAYGYEVGDPLYDWPVGRAGMEATAGLEWTETDWRGLLQNVRIVANQDTTQTLFFPPDPDDGARIGFVDPKNLCAAHAITLNGNGRLIEGAATQAINTSASRLWFYRAELGSWMLLSALTAVADEVFPFPEEFDDYFITKLAMRLNPRYGRSMGEESVAALELSLRKLRARYRQKQSVPVDLGALVLTDNYGSGHRHGRIVRGRNGWMK